MFNHPDLSPSTEFDYNTPNAREIKLNQKLKSRCLKENKSVIKEKIKSLCSTREKAVIFL